MLEWLKSKTLIIPNANEDAEQQEYSSLLVGMCHGTTTLKTVRQFLTKLNIVLPYDPIIVFSGI